MGNISQGQVSPNKNVLNQTVDSNITDQQTLLVEYDLDTVKGQFSDFINDLSGAEIDTDKIVLGAWGVFDGSDDPKGSKKWGFVLDSLEAGKIPTGMVKNYKTGDNFPFNFDGDGCEIPEALKAERKAESERKATEAKALVDAKHRQAALDATALLEAGIPVDEHPYLTRKQIQAHGLRTDGENRLLIPVMDAMSDAVLGLQFISSDGSKKYLQGSKKKGCCYVIGNIPNSQEVLISEGFATAATLHEKLGIPSVVAFDAGNLPEVAKALADRYPDKTFTLCGDNDASGIGQKHALEAAQAIGGKVAIPKREQCDWNDILSDESQEIAKTIFNQSLDTITVKEAIPQKARKVRTRLPNSIPPDYWTDLTVAGRFSAYCRDSHRSIRYIHETSQFVVWDTHWVLDHAGVVITALYSEFVASEAKSFQAQLAGNFPVLSVAFKELSKLRGHKKFKDVLAFVKTLQGVPVSLLAFDGQPHLIQAESVTGEWLAIDLRNGLARPVVEDDLLLKVVGTKYSKGATCPNWEETVKNATVGNTEYAQYLKAQMGYFLWGHNSEEIFTIWHGAGANLKSTVRECLRDIFGDYAYTISTTVLTKDSDEARRELSNCVGKRLLLCNETSHGEKMLDGVLKTVASTETVNARGLYCSAINFRPQFKVLLASNHLPKIPQIDGGAARRLHICPFKYRVPDAEQDKHYRSKKLIPEYAGILNWLIEGAVQYNHKGLKKPAIVVGSTDNFILDCDLFAQWRRDCTRPEGSKGISRTPELWLSFTNWHRSEFGVDVHKNLSSRLMIRALVEAGFEEGRSKTERGIRGLVLTSY